ncbi:MULTISPECIES: LexA family protein [Streptomyces]|uniref:LexA family protein n=1 Tax=Streptomyces TaxID=1883 RepID=UPI00211D8934|nr:hypothetical protein [Streptomyces sp. st170]
MREIGERVGLSSTSSVARQFGRLEARGLITRTAGTGARASWARNRPPGGRDCGARDLPEEWTGMDDDLPPDLPRLRTLETWASH